MSALQLKAPQVHGYGCYCRMHDSPSGDSVQEVELAALVAGWKIGHSSGQAHYAHPDCAPGLFEPLDLCPLAWWMAGAIDIHGRKVRVSGDMQLRRELAAGDWYAKTAESQS